MSAAEPLLQIKNLNAGYGDIEVLHGIDLQVLDGEFVCIIGANTAGKSTILRTISRMVPHVTGTIHFRGSDLAGRASHEIPALGIAHVPEGRHVFPDMTVEENLLLGSFTARKADDLAARMESAFELFPRLRERRDQLAGTLSGGEQQMVAIGRALVAAPRLLLLDEPSLGLAPIVVKAVFRALRDIRASTPILIVEQNTAQALKLCDRAAALVQGKIVMEGSAAEMSDRTALLDSYLGQKQAHDA